MATYETSGGAPGGSGTTDVAREQASNVGQTAASAASDVAQTTKEQGKEVVAEAKQQARDLVGEARSQVSVQASTQRDRAVSGLHALGDELDQMAERGGQSGTATEIARQLSGRTHEVARFLESHEPGDLLDELRRFARRRSGTFLIGAAVAGVLAGRLTKAARADASDSTDAQRVTAYPDAGYPTDGGFRAPGLDSGYPEPVPAYGTPEPAYGAPAYGTPEPAYSAPAYGAPATPGYGTTEPGFGSPDPAHGAPAAPAYGSADPAYGAPAYVEPGYGEPGYVEPGYVEPGYGEQPNTGLGYPDPATGGAEGYPAPAPDGPAVGDEREQPARGWTP